jgi:hypothetical protein
MVALWTGAWVAFFALAQGEPNKICRYVIVIFLCTLGWASGKENGHEKYSDRRTTAERPLNIPEPRV